MSAETVYDFSDQEALERAADGIEFLEDAGLIEWSRLLLGLEAAGLRLARVSAGPEDATELWTGPADIACCEKHGLHGARTHCFACGEPVAQIRMRPVAEIAPLLAALKAVADDTENGPDELGEIAAKALTDWEAKDDE